LSPCSALGDVLQLVAATVADKIKIDLERIPAAA
jgi:hypothetical protein